MRKIQLFFINMFPKLILENEIVASILSVVSMKISVMKEEVDKTLNIDI